MGDEVVPYKIDVAEAELDDLRDRLRRTRWPEAETVDDWSQGTPLAYLQEVCAYWADGYDWRRCEARAERAAPRCAPRSTGWASTSCTCARPTTARCRWSSPTGGRAAIIEFAEGHRPAHRPDRHGGEAADAFHVVCPSLPGFGFSDKPAEHGWNVERIADAWAT